MAVGEQGGHGYAELFVVLEVFRDGDFAADRGFGGRFRFGGIGVLANDAKRDEARSHGYFLSRQVLSMDLRWPGFG